MQSRSVFTRKSSHAGDPQAAAAAAARDASTVGSAGGGMPTHPPTNRRSTSRGASREPTAASTAEEYLRSPAASSRGVPPLPTTPMDVDAPPLGVDPYKTTLRRSGRAASSIGMLAGGGASARAASIASIQMKVADLFASGVARCMLRNANMTDDSELYCFHSFWCFCRVPC